MECTTVEEQKRLQFDVVLVVERPRRARWRSPVLRPAKFEPCHTYMPGELTNGPIKRPLGCWRYQPRVPRCCRPPFMTANGPITLFSTSHPFCAFLKSRCIYAFGTPSCPLRAASCCCDATSRACRPMSYKHPRYVSLTCRASACRASRRTN